MFRKEDFHLSSLSCRFSLETFLDSGARKSRDLGNLAPEKAGTWEIWRQKKQRLGKSGARKSRDLGNLAPEKAETWEIWRQKKQRLGNLAPEKAETWKSGARKSRNLGIWRQKKQERLCYVPLGLSNEFLKNGLL